MNKIYSIKTKDDTTLFAELVGTNDKFLTIKNPLLVTIGDKGELLLSDWIPFIKDRTVSLPLSSLLFVEPITEKYLKFYVSVLFQLELSEIKEQFLTANLTEIESLYRIKELISNFTISYGDLAKEVINIEELENKIEKLKSLVH